MTDVDATGMARDDGSALVDAMQELSRGHFSHLGSLTAIECKPSSFKSSYGADIVSLHFSSGRSVEVFRKDFRSAPASRRDREIYVYQQLLPDSRLGTPTCYGAVIDDDQPRHWLFLEYVPGLAVKHRSFDFWVEGARWLGVMQSRFERWANMSLRTDLLRTYDLESYHSVAEAAVEAARDANAEWAPRVQAVVDELVPRLAAEAPSAVSIVHGDYKPIQIIIDDSQQQIRVCPVDWEKCGIGSAYYDLATLTEGFDARSMDVLLDAYVSTAPQQVSGSVDEARRGVEVFRLQGLLNRLRMSRTGRFPPEAVLKLLQRAESQCRVVRDL